MKTETIVKNYVILEFSRNENGKDFFNYKEIEETITKVITKFKEVSSDELENILKPLDGTEVTITNTYRVDNDSELD